MDPVNQQGVVQHQQGAVQPFVQLQIDGQEVAREIFNNLKNQVSYSDNASWYKKVRIFQRHTLNAENRGILNTNIEDILKFLADESEITIENFIKHIDIELLKKCCIKNFDAIKKILGSDLQLGDPLKQLLASQEFNPSNQNEAREFYRVLEEKINEWVNELSQSKVIERKNYTPPISYKPYKPGRIQNLLTACNFFLANHEPSYQYEAMQVLQFYAIIFAIPILAAGFLDEGLTGLDTLPEFVQAQKFVSSQLIITAVGLVVTFGLLLYVLNRKSSIPMQIKPLANLILDAKECKVEPLLGRDEIIEKIFSCWKSSNSTHRQHPLLVGPAGVGKSVIFLEIARRMVKQEVPTAYANFLKNKRIFGGSAALLLPSNQMFEGDEKIERVIRQIEPHKESIILALDEIHVLFNEENGSRYAELLKSLLETGIRGIPYFIGATTEVEYRKYIAGDAARARRFKVIPVQPLTQTQVSLALREMVTREFPNIILPEEILTYIYAKTETLVEKFQTLKQPEISSRILMSAISKISLKQQQAPSEDILKTKKVYLENLKSQTLSTSKKNSTLDNEISKLNEGLFRLEQKLKQKENLLKEFNNVFFKIFHCNYNLYLINKKLRDYKFEILKKEREKLIQEKEEIEKLLKDPKSSPEELQKKFQSGNSEVEILVNNFLQNFDQNLMAFYEKIKKFKKETDSIVKENDWTTLTKELSESVLFQIETEKCKKQLSELKLSLESEKKLYSQLTATENCIKEMKDYYDQVKKMLPFVKQKSPSTSDLTVDQKIMEIEENNLRESIEEQRFFLIEEITDQELLLERVQHFELDARFEEESKRLDEGLLNLSKRKKLKPIEIPEGNDPVDIEKLNKNLALNESRRKILEKLQKMAKRKEKFNKFLQVHQRLTKQYQTAKLTEKFFSWIESLKNKINEKRAPNNDLISELSKKEIAFNKLIVETKKLVDEHEQIKAEQNQPESLYNQIQRVTQEIENLKISEEKEKKSLDTFKKLSERLSEAYKNLQYLASQIKKNQDLGLVEGDERKRLIFTKIYLIPHLEKERQTIIRELGIPTLDTFLIDELIDEYEKSMSKTSSSAESEKPVPLMEDVEKAIEIFESTILSPDVTEKSKDQARAQLKEKVQSAVTGQNGQDGNHDNSSTGIVPFTTGLLFA